MKMGMKMKMVAISRFRSRYFVVVNFVREGNLKCHPNRLRISNRTTVLSEKRVKSLSLTLEVEYSLAKALK